ncbi:MAG TPA: hypothetical protein VHR35_11800 [Nocardioides sp.]|nr:hypothetical protein [Nocardioides sp.]
MSETASNPLWRLAEIYHAVVYFAPERPERYTALGLKGGWMGYFATRSAALGRVSPAAVTAAFYNFKHTMVERALPDAWLYTTPELAVAARLDVFDAAITRLLGDRARTREVAEAARLAGEAVRRTDTPGRVMYAAHAALPVPEQPHLALFWATAALREHRGDAHNIALAYAEVDGCEAHVLLEALALVPSDQRVYRGWDDDDWAAARERLRVRGWLDAQGRITATGRRARADIERETDRLSVTPWLRLGDDACQRLVTLLTPLASGIVTGGGVPYPNGMGSPAVPELAASG